MDNRIQEAFSHIEAPPELTESTRLYLDRQRKRREARQRPRYALAAVCAALLLVIGAGGFYAARTPVAYVSIDVNPSIELSLNSFDRVLSAKAMNEDGEQVLSGLTLEGESCAAAVERIVGSPAMGRYLTEDSALCFTVAASPALERRLLLELESCGGCREYGGQCYSADRGNVEAAHELGLSLGKYSAYLTLLEYGGELSVEDCMGMTMAELHGLISAYQGGGGQGAGAGGSGGQGAGGHHGGGNGNGKH